MFVCLQNIIMEISTLVSNLINNKAVLYSRLRNIRKSQQINQDLIQFNQFDIKTFVTYIISLGKLKKSGCVTLSLNEREKRKSSSA